MADTLREQALKDAIELIEKSRTKTGGYLYELQCIVRQASKGEQIDTKEAEKSLEKSYRPDLTGANELTKALQWLSLIANEL